MPDRVKRASAEIQTRGLFGPHALERAKARLLELLDASVIVRGTQIGPDGRREYVEMPDNAIRLAAAVKLIELETGRAPQTVDVRTTVSRGQPVSAADLAQMALANPRLARTVLDGLLQSAKTVQEADVSEVTGETGDRPSDSWSGGSERGAPPSSLKRP